MPGLELRELSEHRHLLAHQPLHHPGEIIDVFLRAVRMHDQPEGAIGVPSAFGTVNVLRTKSESSVGLSRKYCRFGAVNVNGSLVGNSCVPAFQFEPAGGTNVIRIGRASSPAAHRTPPAC